MIVYASAIVIILAVLLFYSGLHSLPSAITVDTVAVNEIVKQAELNLDDPAALGRTDFTYRFFIVNNEGEVLYTSDRSLPDNAQTAIRRGFLPMSIEKNGRAAGMALIETHPEDSIGMALARLRAISVVSFLALCAVNIAFLAVFYRSSVKPFRQIERFAQKISAGVFDEPLPANKNNPFGLFTHSFDIMRDSLLDARQKQYRAERAQKELIASLSHDIKTPLTSIRLITELLQVGAGDSAISEKLATIEMKANQIDRLMNDMLLSALDELGELTVTPVSEDCGVLPEMFKSADHLSLVRLGSIPPCMVELDPARMEQVIGNVIINSYKYAGTDIDVTFNIAGEGLQIDIDDYGDGVEPEALELITTKFYRGHNAVASQKEGEGLGLYVAKQLMEKMGGGLEALNRGDGFTIRLWVRLSR